MRKAIDDWRRTQDDLPSRSEAIRRLVEQALAAAPGGKPKRTASRAAGAAYAEQEAAAEIERRQRGSGQAESEKSRRKRRLLKGPEEFAKPAGSKTPGQMSRMPKEPSKAGEYRKRAAKVGKSVKGRSPREREALLRKKKALEDMADNEDWLDGKPGSQLKKYD